MRRKPFQFRNLAVALFSYMGGWERATPRAVQTADQISVQ
jgi:hypothetical protein